MEAMEQDKTVGVSQSVLDKGRPRIQVPKYHGHDSKVSFFVTFKKKKKKALTRVIARFNAVSRWVATEIVRVEDLQQRVNVLAHFLDTMAVPPSIFSLKRYVTHPSTMLLALLRVE